MSDEGFYAIEFDGRPGVAYCRQKWDILYLCDHGYPVYTCLGSEDKAFAGLKIVAAVNERDAGRQRTAVHGTKEQPADALHTVTVERDALRQQFDGNEEPCVICDELCSSYAGNPNRWPVRLGNDGWRHIGCVNKQLAERGALWQALEEARRALRFIEADPAWDDQDWERAKVVAAKANTRIDAILKGGGK